MPSPAHHALRHNGRNNSLAKIVMVVAVVEPLMTLPQIIQIWTTRDVHSLSLITWVLYVFASCVWLLYGLKIHNKALAITGALWTLVDAAIVVEILAWQ